MKNGLMFAATAGLLAVSAMPASAAVLYDNGATDTALNSRPINFGGEVANSFTLEQAATITGINFQSLDFPGSPATTINSVNWAITPGVDFAAATTAAATASSYLLTQQNGYNVDSNAFSTGDLTLAAGTYYLLLEGATTTTGSQAYWSESDGSSTAYQNGFPYSPSESFQVLGSPAGVSAVPETATWMMMIGGFGMVGGAMRRKRSVNVRKVSFA